MTAQKNAYSLRRLVFDLMATLGRFKAMKENIHPQYNLVTIACACGAKYETRSTRVYNVDVCSACHPYFTGKSKLLDTEGRVERFKRKYQQKN